MDQQLLQQLLKNDELKFLNTHKLFHEMSLIEMLYINIDMAHYITILNFQVKNTK